MRFYVVHKSAMLVVLFFLGCRGDVDTPKGKPGNTETQSPMTILLVCDSENGLAVDVSIKNDGKSAINIDGTLTAFFAWEIVDGISRKPIEPTVIEPEKDGPKASIVAIEPGESINRRVDLGEPGVYTTLYSRAAATAPDGQTLVVPHANNRRVRYQRPQKESQVVVTLLYDGTDPDQCDAFALINGKRPEAIDVFMGTSSSNTCTLH